MKNKEKTPICANGTEESAAIVMLSIAGAAILLTIAIIIK